MEKCTLWEFGGMFFGDKRVAGEYALLWRSSDPVKKVTISFCPSRRHLHVVAVLKNGRFKQHYFKTRLEARRYIVSLVGYMRPTKRVKRLFDLVQWDKDGCLVTYNRMEIIPSIEYLSWQDMRDEYRQMFRRVMREFNRWGARKRQRISRWQSDKMPKRSLGTPYRIIPREDPRPPERHLCKVNYSNCDCG